ncbi:MAG: 3-oxoacyl-ACP synthase [Desulfobulbaceae bacterium]|nr:3-oxoacyl-ACP synthase [Desulfobulbaceae bacterium]
MNNNRTRVCIAGLGLVSALGDGLAATETALRHGQVCLGPLRLFPLLQGADLPVGQAVFTEDKNSPLPRTHQLALHAAKQALANSGHAPDAIVVGCTTGGMLSTENMLAAHPAAASASICGNSVCANSACRYHALATVGAELARFTGCSGPVLTVSTACSSGALALALALRLLRRGQARRVLAGGVDSLCRLTFFGFHSLQLVDATGPKPMDRYRRGMAVGEGAAMLLLSSAEEDTPLAELLGAGLSCDAYHPASPHPQGDGALAAMRSALADAGLAPEDIDYLNLHGTGTVDNDLAEARAIRRLFAQPPPLSSIKGASGHSLAAAGAIEAVLASLALAKGFIPANIGFTEFDPDLGLRPQDKPVDKPLRSLLSNSFGFGGNNASLVFAAAGAFPEQPKLVGALPPLAVHACACFTGAGDLAATLARLESGQSCAGRVEIARYCTTLPARQLRRLQRLAKLSLALAAAVVPEVEPAAVDSVFMGTGWGSLSETADFLARLEESGQQFPSPTDFIGSVHNSPAGQVALLLGAKGANVTTSGGEQSFEQACFAANLLACRNSRHAQHNDQQHTGQDEPGPLFALLLGADEAHVSWSPMLDAAISPDTPLADGGGALLLRRDTQAAMAVISHCQLFSGQTAVTLLLDALGGARKAGERIGLILAGISAAEKGLACAQLEEFRQLCGQHIPVCLYRDFLGQFASASAVAAVLAVSLLREQYIPAALLTDQKGVTSPFYLAGKSVLLLGCGHALSAVEFALP